MADWRVEALLGHKVKWIDVVKAGAEYEANWERDFASETAHIIPTRHSFPTPEVGKIMPYDDGVNIPCTNYLMFRLGNAVSFQKRN